MKRLILLAITLIVAAGVYAATMEDIRAAVAIEYAAAKPEMDVAMLIPSLDENGRWPDIDYTDQSRSLWQLEYHLDRLVDLSKAFRHEGAADAELLDAINRGLANWFDNNYTNPNWWYAKIGVPRRMLAIAYLVDDKLSADLHNKINEALNAIDSDDFPARPGGDRIQVLSNHAKVLVWRRDKDGVANILDKIEAEARIAPHEEVMYDAGGNLGVRNEWRPSGRGVQADKSFHHRGDRVNSTLTYGLELPEYFSYWAKMLMDTEHQFSSESINFIIDYYLDGVCRHLVAGSYAEPSIMNRELSRPGAGVFDSTIAKKLLDISNGYRADELAQAIGRLNGEVHKNDSYADYFWQSDYFVFSRPGFQSAVRIYSERNANQEAPHNNEGLRNHFRGDGANILSVSGREYADIAPVFDFRRIPGATTALIPYEPLSEWGDVVVLNSPIQFSGAVNDSIYGCVAFDFASSRSDLKARKAWFFFDNEYLCLGAGISSSSNDTVVTTIEQSLSPSASLVVDGDWFFHNGNAYHILDGNASAAVDHRKGAWRNCVANVDYADDVVEQDVFQLTINHGISPENAIYAYAVVPNDTAKIDHSFLVLANDANVQAAASKSLDLLYIVFYEKGELSAPLGVFAADNPCIIMQSGDTLYVADPTRKLSEIEVTTPKGTHLVALPKGDFRGSAAHIDLKQ